MKKLFQKIQVELPKQPSPKKNANNYYMLLEVVGMCKKLPQKLPSPKKRRLRKKNPKKDDEIKRKLTKADQYWNSWKFQKKLE